MAGIVQRFLSASIISSNFSTIVSNFSDLPNNGSVIPVINAGVIADLLRLGYYGKYA